MKHYKPTSSSRRQMTGYDFSNLSDVAPLKSKVSGFQRSVGRNNQGRITTRHRGGGVKRLYREIDFKQNKLDVPGKVFSIEYDPNRTARIARINYLDGDKRYILAPENLVVGAMVVTAEKTSLEPANRMKLKNIPAGTFIHNLEFRAGQGGKIVKSAGSAATIVAHDGKYVQIQLPSSEVRRFDRESFGSIGRVSNIEHSTIVLGKAGRSRYLGRRPAVRGTAMNPVDHPHGGGEGRQPIGLSSPKTPWGKKALGVKTRDKKKKSSLHILRRRRK